MITYNDYIKNAIEVVKQVIADKGRGMDYPAYKRQGRYAPVDAEAKEAAVYVLDEFDLYDEFKQAVETGLNGKITGDYPYRILAFFFQKDAYNHVITAEILRAAKQYRVQMLGMTH